MAARCAAARVGRGYCAMHPCAASRPTCDMCRDPGSCSLPQLRPGSSGSCCWQLWLRRSRRCCLLSLAHGRLPVVASGAGRCGGLHSSRCWCMEWSLGSVVRGPQASGCPRSRLFRGHAQERMYGIACFAAVSWQIACLCHHYMSLLAVGSWVQVCVCVCCVSLCAYILVHGATRVCAALPTSCCVQCGQGNM